MGQEPVWITRAPGRLDVMGGIADYSGSLVLQLPLAHACHVASQVKGCCWWWGQGVSGCEWGVCVQGISGSEGVERCGLMDGWAGV